MSMKKPDKRLRKKIRGVLFLESLFRTSLGKREGFEHERKKHHNFGNNEQKSKRCTLPYENVNKFFNKIVCF